MTSYLPKGNREMTIVAVSFASGGMLIGFGCHIQLAVAAWGGEKAGAVLSGAGSILTGFGTLALAAAGFAGVQKWEKRRKMQRHAVLADRVLVFSVELANILKSVSSDYPWPTRNAAPTLKQPVWQRLTDRALVKRLDNLRDQVDTVLMPTSLAIFNLLLDRRERMRKMMEADLNGSSPPLEDWFELFSGEGCEALAEDLGKVKAHFKDLAFLS
jgi:hypothetical protein